MAQTDGALFLDEDDLDFGRDNIVSSLQSSNIAQPIFVTDKSASKGVFKVHVGLDFGTDGIGM